MITSTPLSATCSDRRRRRKSSHCRGPQKLCATTSQGMPSTGSCRTSSPTVAGSRHTSIPQPHIRVFTAPHLHIRRSSCLCSSSSSSSTTAWVLIINMFIRLHTRPSLTKRRHTCIIHSTDHLPPFRGTSSLSKTTTTYPSCLSPACCRPIRGALPIFCRRWYHWGRLLTPRPVEASRGWTWRSHWLRTRC